MYFTAFRFLNLKFLINKIIILKIHFPMHKKILNDSNLHVSKMVKTVIELEPELGRIQFRSI